MAAAEPSDMFTGIVETTGEIVGREATDEGVRLTVAAPGLDDLHHGQSISVSGVCLTVEAFGADVEGVDEAVDEADDATAATGDRDRFEVFLAAETVAKTYLGDLRAGDRVNVERAMPADGRFDGHLVQGHVDTVATVEAVASVGEDWRLTVSIPAGFGQYLVQKGSVTLDGISLTVAERRADAFEVAIIPTTYEVTTLSEKEPGDPLHLEVDVIAKYVENMVEGYAAD